MKEGQYNSELAKKLNTRNFASQKMADRFTPGIPDIYIQGGHWIESKVIKVKSSTNLLDKLTGNQQTWGNRMVAAGDKVLVASYWEYIGYVLVLPLPILMGKPTWSIHEAESNGYPLGKGLTRHDYITEIFTHDQHARTILTAQYAHHFPR